MALEYKACHSTPLVEVQFIDIAKVCISEQGDGLHNTRFITCT